MNAIQLITIYAIPVIFAITLHEVAHGWAAKYLGDRTAEMMGRLTLNPFRHMDPIGTGLLPIMLMLLKSPIIFGWAKPVPVTWENLDNPRRDMALVALAGPGANLLMAVFWFGVMQFVVSLENSLSDYALEFFMYMAQVGIIINIVLMVLNLIPIPPLDGSRVVSAMLPGPWAYQYSRLEPYGFFILIALVFALYLFL